MRKALKIYAVVFAFLLAGVLGVGTAEAQAQPDIQPLNECPDPDTGGQTTYWKHGPCPPVNSGAAATSQNGNQSAGQAQTQSYDQSQAAPESQTDPQAATESDKKKSTGTQKADNPNTTVATVDVAGATESKQPIWLLGALLAVAGLAGVYAFVMRRADSFWHQA